MGHAIQTQTFHQPLNAATKTWSSGTTQTRRENQSIYQPHQRHQQYPQPVRGPTRQAEFHTGYATTAPFSDTAEKSPWENANLRQIGSIPTEDITYLRGKDWMEAVEQRVRDLFLPLEQKQKKMLHHPHMQKNSNMY
jgi:hypothetical protein